MRRCRFLKKYVPGFENAVLSNVGRFVGVRDGRHPVGEHVFSIDDARAGRKFRDAVTKPMTKPFYWDNHAKYTFEVPFRCFLPKKINNLILTGASLSFTYDTIFMVMRNFPWCTQTGEIAGYAAARCIGKEYFAEGTGVDDAVFLDAPAASKCSNQSVASNAFPPRPNGKRSHAEAKRRQAGEGFRLNRRSGFPPDQTRFRP